MLTHSIKRACEIRKFHVAVVQKRLRNVQKSVMHVQSFFFVNLNLLFFCCSLKPLQKLGSFSIDDGNGSENVSFKMNFRFFNLCRVYSNLLKMASVGEFPWS